MDKPLSMSVLWYRIATDFYEHPKALSLKVNERELFQRAIAYSKRHLTDGFLTRETLRQIGKMQVVDLCECLRRGRSWMDVCDEWIDTLSQVGLLDVIDQRFFQVHDYLEWNSSRKHVMDVQIKRRLAGKNGGMAKQNNMLEDKQSSGNLPAKCLAKSYQAAGKSLPIVHSTEYKDKEEEKSMSGHVQKQSRPTLSDAEWMESLKINPAYNHINFTIENGRMDAWLALPKNRHRKKTRQFVLNWLNKIERPLAVQQQEKKRTVQL